MRYRRALDRCFLTVAVLWIAWCLCWPFLARRHDIQRAVAEADAAYQVCVRERIFTAADCRADRQAYRTALSHAAAPPDENAYQWFAGREFWNAAVFMGVLCLAPPLIVFAVLRLVLELLLFARMRLQKS